MPLKTGKNTLACKSAESSSTEFIAVTPVFHSVLLLMTNACNLTCKHCYVSSHPRGEHGLSVSDVMRFSLYLRDKYGSLNFDLSGGEPLSRRVDCLSLLCFLSEHHKVRLLTNGTLITRDIALALKDYQVRVRVSIDGGTNADHDNIRGKGAFKNLCRGLQNLLDVGYPTSMLQAYATIPPGGTKIIPHILDFADEYGISFVKFESLAKAGRALLHWLPGDPSREDPDLHGYEEFFANEFAVLNNNRWSLEDLTQWDLDFGTITIYYNGQVYPYTWQNDFDEKLGRMGNIKKDSFDKILSDATIQQAVLGKFIAFARGPRRSLHAFAARRLRGPDL